MLPVIETTQQTKVNILNVIFDRIVY